MPTLVLIRHGQSQWNLENRFTGWIDIDLSPAGIAEARHGGRLMREQGLQFDVAFTSVLKRAIRTAWIVLDELDRMWIPLIPAWELNERHYGALQGLDKAETAAKHGESQVKIWRRSFDTPPPMLAADDPGHPACDPRYRAVPGARLPSGESLKDTIARVVPYFETRIVPELLAGRTVLVAAHGNSLRALVKHLDGMSESEIMELNIPTGVPLVYDLELPARVKSRRYLGDPAAVAAAMAAVAAQGQKRS